MRNSVAKKLMKIARQKTVGEKPEYTERYYKNLKRLYKTGKIKIIDQK